MEYFKELIVTTDCAGSIGLREHDQVQVDYETLAYYTLRNAVFENLSKMGEIVAVSYANFIGDDHLEELLTGMNKVLHHLQKQIIITGSTESNFAMKESAFSVTVIGVMRRFKARSYDNYAVIGLPLVGKEVIENNAQVVTLEEVLALQESKEVSKIIPIGSKGINDRASTVLGGTFESSDIDLYKSAGPSTCVLIEYNNIDEVRKIIDTKITKLEEVNYA